MEIASATRHALPGRSIERHTDSLPCLGILRQISDGRANAWRCSPLRDRCNDSASRFGRIQNTSVCNIINWSLVSRHPPFMAGSRCSLDHHWFCPSAHALIIKSRPGIYPLSFHPWMRERRLNRPFRAIHPAPQRPGRLAGCRLARAPRQHANHHIVVMTLQKDLFFLTTESFSL